MVQGSNKYAQSPTKASYGVKDGYKTEYDFLRGEGPSAPEVSF